MSIANKWRPSQTAKFKGELKEPSLLLYRSNLLGSDKRITNFGGGNTSVKTSQRDPLFKRATEVMWVKGSGGDLGSMGLDGFAVLCMDALHQLKNIYRGKEHEDEMAAILPQCAFGESKRAASIDTPLHAYIPHTHVDHMHPDAVIAVAAARDSKRITKQIYGDKIGWLPWRRPGFELGLILERFTQQNPDSIGVVLGSHGLFTWADDAKLCYERTLWAINTADKWLTRKSGRKAPFGKQTKPLSPQARQEMATALLPVIRGLAGADESRTGHAVISGPAVDFASSAKVNELAKLGTSCPDHFLRTKIRPLVIPPAVAAEAAAGDSGKLVKLCSGYRDMYASYYKRNKLPGSPAMRDANAVIYLVPQVGMLSLARDKATARIASEYYTNAINVMRGAERVDHYTGLTEREAFNIEYWDLEEAKLQRMPPRRSLAGRIALVTGGGGGIGKAICVRLLEDGANVVLSDINKKSLSEVGEELAKAHGADRVRTVAMDVTNERQVVAALKQTAFEYGGLDILVCCAGISIAAPIEETDISVWDHNMDILAKGYFLVAREGFKLLGRQNLGGSVIFIASKNGLAASPNASAYCTAKAAEIHLARCLALEGGERGIRVNVVNPDAVLQDSGLWSSSWRKDRASAYGIKTSELPAYYSNRSVLKRSVYPQDVAEAVCFLANDTSSKSTGNIINVDAGHPVSFSR